MKTGMELVKFKGGIELIRNEIFAELPAQQILMLLIVAEREGIDQQDFQKLLGVPAGTVSRNLARLSSKVVTGLNGKQGDIGYGLLDVRPHPTDIKSNQVFLSEKGLSFMQKLINHLQSDRSGT
jgi:DNA-binding MarR family transcriptional regulator